MSKIIMIILSLILASCNLMQQDKKQGERKISFLKHDYIVKVIKYPLEQQARYTPPDKRQERMGSIIPEKLFFKNEAIQRAVKKKPCTEKYDKEIIAKSKFIGNGEVDLRSRDTYVTQQIGGTCTAHGLAAAIENLSGTKVKLSEEHIWSEYRQYQCDVAIKTWSNTNKCVTDNRCWELGSKNPSNNYLKKECCNTYLKKSTYLDDDIQLAINALDRKSPVYLATSVSSSMLNCDAVINAKSDNTNGGHALSIVGYRLDESILGGGYFIVKNSWGSDCGDNGYQYLPFYHCLRSNMYCLFWSIDEIATMPSKNPTPASECLEWKRIWWRPWKWTCLRWST